MPYCTPSRADINIILIFNEDPYICPAGIHMDIYETFKFKYMLKRLWYVNTYISPRPIFALGPKDPQEDAEVSGWYRGVDIIIRWSVLHCTCTIDKYRPQWPLFNHSFRGMIPIYLKRGLATFVDYNLSKLNFTQNVLTIFIIIFPGIWICLRCFCWFIG